MTRRATIIGTILTLSLAASVSAQEVVTTEAQRNAEAQARQQTRIFEGVLQTAVRQGGEAFVRQQAPELPNQIQLTANDPQAHGFALPGGGLLFSVAVPEIRVMITELLVQQLRPRPQEAVRPAGNQRRGDVSNASGIPGAQGIAPPDPMTVSPSSVDTPVLPLDDGRCAARTKNSTAAPFDYWYAVSVCDALMDAMLDNSGPLPIKESEWLTVAIVPESTSPGVLNASSGFTTYLTIKGADLLQYRQGKLSKEEARKLIEMMRR